jgi:hypothetical protein
LEVLRKEEGPTLVDAGACTDAGIGVGVPASCPYEEGGGTKGEVKASLFWYCSLSFPKSSNFCGERELLGLDKVILD